MQISPQSKSFIALMLVAIGGTFACLILWGILGQKRLDYLNSKVNKSAPQQTAETAPPRQGVDISGWKTYTNQDYKISFQYDPNWKIGKPKTKNGFTYIEIDPGRQYFNMRLYISSSSFYIMDGLPTVTENIGGFTALNVNYALYGIQTKDSYYTFDVGYSMPLLPQFDAMVHTVKFLN